MSRGLWGKETQLSDAHFNCCHRAIEDRELENRIKMHMEKLQEHRTRTYGSLEEEMESARKNLEMASISFHSTSRNINLY